MVYNSVPMEPNTLDTTNWFKPFGLVLGCKLYDAIFAFDIVENESEFDGPEPVINR